MSDDSTPEPLKIIHPTNGRERDEEGKRKIATKKRIEEEDRKSNCVGAEAINL